MNFIETQYKRLLEDGKIDSDLYDVYNVKRGLRNSNGTGVRVGLTKICLVTGVKIVQDIVTPIPGKLFYRDMDIYDLASLDRGLDGYEKIVFLLLFGHYPSKEEVKEIRNLLSTNYLLPETFFEDVLLRKPSPNIMINIQKAILSLYSYDPTAEDSSPYGMIEKGLCILAKMPAIIVGAYLAKRHLLDKQSLLIHFPNKNLTIAESILFLLREDSKYSSLEADTLDLSLMLHADHGGGNNSTFVGSVVSSTNTDIYSCISACIGALKGFKHGGANQAVAKMMQETIEEVGIDATDEALSSIIHHILNKEFYDKSGLIYGIGHAIYTINDPRAILLKEKCAQLSKEKDPVLFSFYERFEQIAAKVLFEKKGKPFCVNIDFYSGLVYQYLNIPMDLYPALFATARISGWLAHIVETKLYSNKIIRPACVYVGKKGMGE